MGRESSFDNPTTREILTKLQEAKAEGILDITPGTDGNADHLLAMAGQLSSFTVDSSGAASTVAGVIEGTIAAEDLKEELGVELPPGTQARPQHGRRSLSRASTPPARVRSGARSGT